MKHFASPLIISRQPLVGWASWSLLAKVALLPLIGGSAGFAVVWFGVNDAATLSVYPKSSPAPTVPATTAEPAATPCVVASFLEASDHRTCIQRH